VTDAVMEDARASETRPLDDVHPVVFLDALVLKIRDGGSVQRRACYLALAIRMDGERDVLGMWFQANVGAKFWMQVLNDLKTRGVQDILICCVDGLKGFPEAIEAVYQQTTVQTCIVHLIRQSLKYVPRRQYDAVVKDLKPVYTSNNPTAVACGRSCKPLPRTRRRAWISGFLIEAVRPPAAFALLIERDRPIERAGLVDQQLEVVVKLRRDTEPPR
jgi:hypothetical protein